jgi:aminoglycoside phosphotransferase (APT) family kinase protein
MDIDERIRRHITDAVAGCTLDRITSVTRFDAGNRHRVHRVTYLDATTGRPSDVVVRVSTSADAAERRQAEREAAVLERLGGDVAPRLLDFRFESEWLDTPTMCVAFVAGDHRDLSTVTPGDIARLGAVVASVHARPLDDLRRWFTVPPTLTAYAHDYVEQTIAGYLPRLREPLPAGVGVRVEQGLASVRAGLARAATSAAFRSRDGFVLLHGDLAAKNILWSDQPVLIDWEYARIGDPADEIAYLFGQQGLVEPQREAFWTGYGSRTTDALRARVRWWEPAALLGSALWWLERWSRRADVDAAGGADVTVPRPQHEYLEESRCRLDRYDEVVAASRGEDLAEQ